MTNLRIALAQINLTVGDIHGNFNKVIETLTRAKSQKIDFF